MSYEFYVTIEGKQQRKFQGEAKGQGLDRRSWELHFRMTSNLHEMPRQAWLWENGSMVR